jgi:hypothetical protein
LDTEEGVLVTLTAVEVSRYARQILIPGGGRAPSASTASFGQLAVLIKIGFTKAQGYYWSPAVPADEVPAMVARLAVRQLLAPQPCHEGQPRHDDVQLASDVRQTSVHLSSVESQPASGLGQRRMLD